MLTGDGRKLLDLGIQAIFSIEPRDVSLLFVLFYIHSAGTPRGADQHRRRRTGDAHRGRHAEDRRRAGQADRQEARAAEDARCAGSCGASGGGVDVVVGQAHRAREARDRDPAACRRGQDPLRAGAAGHPRPAHPADADGIGHEDLRRLRHRLLARRRPDGSGHERHRAGARDLRRLTQERAARRAAGLRGRGRRAHVEPAEPPRPRPRGDRVLRALLRVAGRASRTWPSTIRGTTIRWPAGRPSASRRPACCCATARRCGGRWARSTGRARRPRPCGTATWTARSSPASAWRGKCSPRCRLAPRWARGRSSTWSSGSVAIVAIALVAGPKLDLGGGDDDSAENAPASTDSEPRRRHDPPSGRRTPEPEKPEPPEPSEARPATARARAAGEPRRGEGQPGDLPSPSGQPAARTARAGARAPQGRGRVRRSARGARANRHDGRHADEEDPPPDPPRLQDRLPQRVGLPEREQSALSQVAGWVRAPST